MKFPHIIIVGLKWKMIMSIINKNLSRTKSKADPFIISKSMLTPFKNTSRRTPENRLLGIRFVKLNSGNSQTSSKNVIQS